MNKWQLYKLLRKNAGARSRQATRILQGMGYTNVNNIGGIAAYSGKVAR